MLQVTMMMLKLLSLMSLLVMTRCEGVEESVQDQESSSSSLHYNFNHKYGFHDHHSPYAGYKHKHGHHLTDIGKDSQISSSHLHVSEEDDLRSLSSQHHLLILYQNNCITTLVAVVNVCCYQYFSHINHQCCRICRGVSPC